MTGSTPPADRPFLDALAECVATQVLAELYPEPVAVEPQPAEGNEAA